MSYVRVLALRPSGKGEAAALGCDMVVQLAAPGLALLSCQQ